MRKFNAISIIVVFILSIIVGCWKSGVLGDEHSQSYSIESRAVAIIENFSIEDGEEEIEDNVVFSFAIKPEYEPFGEDMSYSYKISSIPELDNVEEKEITSFRIFNGELRFSAKFSDFPNYRNIIENSNGNYELYIMVYGSKTNEYGSIHLNTNIMSVKFKMNKQNGHIVFTQNSESYEIMRINTRGSVKITNMELNERDGKLLQRMTFL